jgi:prepilin-type N-terminal cleavage/methylation domain-containing protein
MHVTRRSYPFSPGFTLVELSIVLVIVGLIIGGVLVGRDMIRAAAVRAQISQTEKYNTAVNTFRDKYNCLPGDCKNAANFGFIARGSFPGQGDGNGIIEGNALNGAANNNGLAQGAGETSVFWVDLSDANLIDGDFSTASSTVPLAGDAPESDMPLYFPAAKIGKGNYVYIYSIDGRNYMAILGITGIRKVTNSGALFSEFKVTVQEAYNIDQKADDGDPQYGSITAQYVSNGPSLEWVAVPENSTTVPTTTGINYVSWRCMDNNNVNGVRPTYTTRLNGDSPNCALSFRMQ